MRTSRFDYDQINPRLRESLDAYARTGRRCGGFLTAVLENDLFEACGRGDDDNVWMLPVIVAYIFNCLPGECHGSREKVTAWREKRGLEGEGHPADRPLPDAPPAKPRVPVGDALEPAGPDLVLDFLGLISAQADRLTVEEIATWTQKERDDVVAWAGAIHLKASDNHGVRIPPRPARVPEWLRA